MIQYKTFLSPLGAITLSAFEGKLNGLYFAETKNTSQVKPCNNLVFNLTEKWLSIYFSGKSPGFTPSLDLSGTKFQQTVWKELLKIPHGETRSYNDIKIQLEAKTKKPSSARAVGGAVAKNKILIIIPCHRVIRSDGRLGGFSAGVFYKKNLLAMEGVGF
ncbi:MAG: methylated-DNA--[protein]-cysteine S-methyltransferase [Treponemataceae bacterium]